MAVEIISIPNVQLKKDGWFLTSLEIDLANKSSLPKYNQYPISQSALLPIGVKIVKGIDRSIDIERHRRPKRDYDFNDFSKGIVEPIGNLPEKIYPMEVPDQVYSETMVYSIMHKGRLTVFFTFELFRQFIGSNSGICRYIMEDNMLEMFKDSEDASDVDGETSLKIEFSSIMEVRLAKSQDFLTNYIFLLYNKELRRFWKEIQSNTDNGTNNFAFKHPPFKKLSLSAEIKEYKDFDLVLNITSMDVEVDFPFERTKITHPLIKEAVRNPKDTKPKSGKTDIELPEGYDFEDQSETPNTNKTSPLSIDMPGIKFKKKPKIERVKAKADPTTKPKISRAVFEEFKLKNIELSFQEPGNKGNVAVPVLTDFKDEPAFDFTNIPSGLQLFCNAIRILASIMNLQYKYEIIPFYPDIKSTFAMIHGSRRNAVLITFPSQPPIYLLEVDSSDGRFISTLIFKDLNDEMSKFLLELFTKLAANGGSWDTDYLGKKCVAEKIRHPKKLSGYDTMTESKVEDSIKNRIAFNLLNILGG